MTLTSKFKKDIGTLRAAANEERISIAFNLIPIGVMGDGDSKLELG